MKIKIPITKELRLGFSILAKLSPYASIVCLSDLIFIYSVQRSELMAAIIEIHNISGISDISGVFKVAPLNSFIKKLSNAEMRIERKKITITGFLTLKQKTSSQMRLSVSTSFEFLDIDYYPLPPPFDRYNYKSKLLNAFRCAVNSELLGKAFEIISSNDIEEVKLTLVEGNLKIEGLGRGVTISVDVPSLSDGGKHYTKKTNITLILPSLCISPFRLLTKISSKISVSTISNNLAIFYVDSSKRKQGIYNTYLILSSRDSEEYSSFTFKKEDKERRIK